MVLYRLQLQSLQVQLAAAAPYTSDTFGHWGTQVLAASEAADTRWPLQQQAPRSSWALQQQVPRYWASVPGTVGHCICSHSRTELATALTGTLGFIRHRWPLWQEALSGTDGHCSCSKPRHGWPLQQQATLAPTASAAAAPWGAGNRYSSRHPKVQTATVDVPPVQLTTAALGNPCTDDLYSRRRHQVQAATGTECTPG